MGKTIDIAALGEVLIDFTEAGAGKDGMKLFEQNPGGAPANLLTAASHMGYHTAFIGKIGTDMHGAFLKKTLQNEGIETKGLIEDPNYFTTLAFVAIDENGERNFSFARKPGADTQLREEDLDKELLGNCRIFHFGSLSLTDEPAHSATLAAIQIAKEAGSLISYDPNYRAPLWTSKEAAIEEMKSVIPMVDIMKISDEESLMITGASSYEAAADQILAQGVNILALTMGGDGVLMATKKKKEVVEAFRTDAVDTTGAGDSFWGGFLSHFLTFDKKVEDLTWEEIRTCAVWGNAVAGLCVQKRGGIPAIPTREEVEQFLREKAQA